MSLYWNNLLLKRLKRMNNIQFKYTLKTEIGRFYFYLYHEEEKDGKIAGKVIFFPKRDFFKKK